MDEKLFVHNTASPSLRPKVMHDAKTSKVNVEAPSVRGALSMLRQAYDVVRSDGVSVWNYAIEIERLRALEISDTELRWLLSHGYVGHRIETTKPTSRRRRFRQAKNIALFARSCFVLTSRGLRLKSEPDRVQLPAWDSDMRVLTFGAQVVKEFRRAAPNQEAILRTFQRRQWARRIDDPLPPTPGIESHSRLHDTIKNLNRCQRNPLLRFRGDGSGKGVVWEAI